MNVPLKKRYNNYSAITKISAISTNTPFSTNQLEAGEHLPSPVSPIHRDNSDIDEHLPLIPHPQSQSEICTFIMLFHLF